MDNGRFSDTLLITLGMDYEVQQWYSPLTKFYLGVQSSVYCYFYSSSYYYYLLIIFIFSFLKFSTTHPLSLLTPLSQLHTLTLSQTEA